VRYFEHNARNLMPVPWDIGPELTADDIAAIGPSLQGFQAGESSEGQHLFRYARAYAEASGDADYVTAVKLFIGEEQRHARDLGRFLTLNGLDLIKSTFPDRVFRKLRNLFGGLETSTTVLVMAEIIALVYYAALREATGSAVLRRLCEQILRDEVKHIEFQGGQLARLRRGRHPLLLACTHGLQRFLYGGTVLVVWLFHGRALRRGGLNLRGYWRACWHVFGQALRVMTPGR
jgi:hypothetical protein